MVFIIGLYITVDVLQHKGQTRILFPAAYPVTNATAGIPGNNKLINLEKNWKQAVNTVEKLNTINLNNSGFECDVYFNIQQDIFEVHHDPDKKTGTTLNDLLVRYQQKKLTASIWLDFKNLTDSNAIPALKKLMHLQNNYNLKNKILVESSRADLLTSFADSSFFTSYYTPMFNPYKIDDVEKVRWVDSIAAAIKNEKVNALSGYYFQYPFLKHYFPGYKILTWAQTNKYSLVNLLFNKKLVSDKSIYIFLTP
ncbi:MAG TPA: hypothetical protein PK987_03230 [Ferruginibacter sp.]|nr:hypothetical protein [Ferruginibacter sp.]